MIKSKWIDYIMDTYDEHLITNTLDLLGVTSLDDVYKGGEPTRDVLENLLKH